MITIHNRIIPLGSYRAMTVYPLLFIKGEGDLSARQLRHEEIHARQQRELMLWLFYIVYFAEWIFFLILYRNARQAYRSISFEREAYKYEHCDWYLDVRERYAMWR